ncbi:hypothetical protein KKG41_05760 [Patescibacteria group bacterium]|nr:hypothetical protein [Patescibacteria group bacterium]MBU1890693.1 hypothetical protein [Patescibacteria group bacterium]
MYQEALQQLGLPRNEAKIYETLINLGPSSVSTISSIGKVNRRNVYDCVKNLLKRRLVVLLEGQKEKIYSAVEPKRLENVLNTQKKEISSVLPGLKKIYNKNIPKEQAFISRGHEGIKNYWNYVTAQTEVTHFVGGKGAWHDEKIEEDRKKYFVECKKKNIKITGIFDYSISEHGQDVYSQYDPKLIRFFPKEYSTNATYDICGDRVVIFPMPKERNIANATIFNIVSKPLADSYRTWFKYLWQKALTYEKVLGRT